MQKLLAAVALVATFASAAGGSIELPTGASASLVGDPGRLEVARGGGMGGGGFRPAFGGMGAGTGGGMMNSGGGMGFVGPGMNSGGIGAGPRDTKCPDHHAKFDSGDFLELPIVGRPAHPLWFRDVVTDATLTKNSPNPLNPLSWLSQCDTK